MKDLDKLNRIEARRKGLLSDEDCAELEAAMHLDAELAAEVEDMEFLLDGFEALEVENFQNQLQSWEAVYQEEAQPVEKEPIATTPTLEIALNTEKQPRPFWRRYYAAAAAIALLASAPFVYRAALSGNSTDDLFKPSTALVIVQRNDAAVSEQDAARNRALEAYNSAKYDEAIQLATSYLQQYSSESNRDVRLYLGLSQLMKKDYAAAVQTLQPLLSAASKETPEAEWATAYAYAQLGQTAEAKHRLEAIIAAPKHAFAAKAKALLETL